MSIQLPKWKTATLNSYEIPHIYRDPPKAKFTQKRDKVDMADVAWMTRPDGGYSDPTRINENIKYKARGVDPIAKIKYGSNPYKLKAIRIPETSIEKTIALSRPRIHQNKTVNTNPGLRPGNSGIDINQKIDLYNVNKITSVEKTPSLVETNAYYKINFLDPTVFDIQPTSKYIDDRTIFYSVFTNAFNKIEQPMGERVYLDKNLKQKTYAQNVIALKARPVYETVVPDLKLLSKQDLKSVIASQSIKLDYTNPEKELPRLINKAVSFNADAPMSATALAPHQVFEYDLINKRDNININTNTNGLYTVNAEQQDIFLDKKVSSGNITEDRIVGMIPRFERQYDDSYQLKESNKYKLKLDMGMYANRNSYP